MNELNIIRDLAIKAGFEFDSHDRNFYSPDSKEWINSQIYKFAELIEESFSKRFSNKLLEYFDNGFILQHMLTKESKGEWQVIDPIDQRIIARFETFSEWIKYD